LSVSLIIGTIFSQAIAIELNHECTREVWPTFEDFYADGGVGSIEISANSNCYWTVISNKDWIIIKSDSSGNGNGDVLYSVSTNNTGVSRTGTITIDGKIVEIDQSDTFVSCKNTATNAFCFPQYKQEGSLHITGLNKYLNNQIIHGSGFLIAPDLILTNSHNFGNNLTKQEREEVAKNCVLYFNYINTECKGTSSDMGEGFDIIEMIEKENPGNFKLNQKDYSVLKLNKSVLNEYGIEPMTISNNITINEDIYVLGHPDGEPRKIYCGEITKLKMLNIYYNYFETNIISSKGVSGGPIINTQFSEVVGILTGGDHQTSSYGLKLSAIFNDIIDILKPSPTELISPDPDTTLARNTPIFTWKQINRAEKYIFKVEPIESGAVINRIYQSSSICNNETCSVELPEPLPNGEYTWKVQTANKNGGYGEYSSDRTISVIDDCSLILSSASPNHIITSGCYEKIYGIAAANQITLERGAKAELINFPGQNTIKIQSSSDMFTVSRSGTVVTFQGSDETILKIPATKNIQTISFNGEQSKVLQIHDNQVKLDDQIEEKESTPGSCGAYIAPGVWKEFDCYNLAAIGKETGADPFTPSWELIGGYWQCGIKGPDPDKEDWYNTNTEHFAHGPTGPGLSEANEGEVNGWGSSGSFTPHWWDGLKTGSDPCPAGFRIPSNAEWQGVIENNIHSSVGPWSSSLDDYTNYNSAQYFGPNLMLPASGYRYNAYNGALVYRGWSGAYWSGKSDGIGGAYLYFDNSEIKNGYGDVLHGLSVRCVVYHGREPPSPQ